MATILNDPACSSVSIGNTGKPNCDLKPGAYIGAILIPRNHVYSVANVADIVHILYDQALAPAAQRAYPIWQFVELKDNSEAPVKVTSSYGEIVTTRSGRYNLDFKMDKYVGSGFWKKILSFKNTNNFDILLVDENNVIWGKEGSTSGTLMGLSIASFEPMDVKVSDGTKPAEYWLSINLQDPREMNETAGFIKPTTVVKDYVKGNIDIILTEGGAEASHTLKIKAKEAISGVDCYSALQDLLAVAGAWVVTNTSTGVAKTISGVAKSAVYNGWTITLSDDSAGEGLTVSLATPAALFALATPVGGPPDEGYESNTLSQTIPT